MLTIRPADERGTADFGWLHSRHTFSFGQYHDPAHMGFGHLRVINEDRVGPGAGFDTHGHRDMEIISYVLEGAIEHRDSLGTGSVIRPGEVQRMSAGSGIRHSEFNHSESRPVHFLQIWILPEHEGLQPGYEQRAFAPERRRGRLQLLASRDGREASLTVHQDMAILGALLAPGEQVVHALAPGRRAWLQLLRGEAQVRDGTDAVSVTAGDGVAATDAQRLRITVGADAELLLFDLA